MWCVCQNHAETIDIHLLPQGKYNRYWKVYCAFPITHNHNVLAQTMVWDKFSWYIHKLGLLLSFLASCSFASIKWPYNAKLAELALCFPFELSALVILFIVLITNCIPSCMIIDRYTNPFDVKSRFLLFCDNIQVDSLLTGAYPVPR